MRTSWREADDVWMCGPYSDPGGQGDVLAPPTDSHQQGTMATTNTRRDNLHPPVRYHHAPPVLYSDTPGLYPVIPSQEWIRFDLAYVDHMRHKAPKAPREGTWKGRQRKAALMFYLLGVLLIFFSVAVVVTFIVFFSGRDIEKQRKGTFYEPNMEFSIGTTWDARALNHTPVVVTLSRHSSGNDVNIHIEAPFFNSPANPGGVAGQPFPQLYNYEVVEVLFLNDKGDYLEVGLGPHGQHLVRMLRGEKNTVKEQLALSYTATITGGNIWRGDAVVPGEYFPEKVTKFNAHAIYGPASKRVYESLYPVPRGQYQEADIHRLAHFRPLEFRRLLPQNHESGYNSSKWNSIKIDANVMEFSIATTWDSQPVGHTPVKVTLSRHVGGNDLNIHVEAPFFNDPPNPGGAAGQPFPKLYNYEVVEAFFLNDQNDYLEVELSPHAQHLVLMLRGERNAVKQQLPMSYTASIHGNTWQGDAVVPGRYFPRDVTKFNAYAIHGTDPNRVYESLYPVPAGKYPAPDFHKLAYFQTIDFQSILPSNHGDSYHSSEWSSVPAHHHDG